MPTSDIFTSYSTMKFPNVPAIVSKVSTSSSTPAVSSDVAELKDMVRALILDKKNQTPAPAPVKAIEQSCVTCGGGHSYQNCPATNDYRDNIQEYVSQAAAVNYNQGNASYRPQMFNRVEVLTLLVKNFQEVRDVSEMWHNPTLLRVLSMILASPLSLPSEEVIFNGGDRCISWTLWIQITPGVDGIYDLREDTVYLEELLMIPSDLESKTYHPILQDRSPVFAQPKILMGGENAKPVVQHQRRVNPKIHEVIKQEVIKLLDAGLIYPISDSPWVSPVHCVPKKGGITVVKNKENELIPTRLVTGWRVCIDYRKLNDATRKDHFPLPFMDQMLERLAGNEYYLLDGFSGYFQIPIDPLIRRRLPFTCH
ncbi:hypothetical protein Tco_1262855 [Tanacetum coccineum]